MARLIQRALLGFGFLVAAFLTNAPAAEIDRSVLSFQLPDQIQWKEQAGVPGVRTAVLLGDPSKPGPYIILVKWLPHNFSQPHTHPNARYIAVLSGTWWIGTGEKFDPDNTIPMRAGSFITHFAGKVHWDGAKDEECILEIVGDGPATTNYVQAH